MSFKSSKNYAGYTVRISKRGAVTLRTPGGRAIGWVCGNPAEQDPAAAADRAARDFLLTFQGATIDDRRIKK